MKVVIVGGVAGGASAAARLRRLDESAEIIILERGNFVSFANCGLPYYIGSVITKPTSLTLQTPQSFKNRFNIEVRTLNEAVKINTDDNTVEVKKLETGEIYIENYDYLVLSPGAEPVKPAIEGVDSDIVFTLRNIPDTFKIKNFIEQNNPKSAVIVGGGYIGLEMAENLKGQGIDVSIVEAADHLISTLDFDMACQAQEYIIKKGIKLYLNSTVKAIDNNTVILENEKINTDMIILSVGVRPETAFLKDSKISLTQKGCIKVDNKMQTNIENVYAVGDAIEVDNFITNKKDFIPLAGPANKQGRIAADNICKLNSEYKGTQGSSILKFFDLTVATTGINEKTATNLNIDYDKTYTYHSSRAGYYPGGNNMNIKALWDKKTLKILGAQIVGFDGVDKRMDVLATAIRLGAKVTDLAQLELCYAPPFTSAKDPVNMLGLVAENVVTKKVNQFFWHDIDNLPRDNSIILLDTRTEYEYQEGRIEGFINIPLDELRNRLDELDKTKTIYVHCRSGFRSYIACRILCGYGYNCFNLAGGFRFYEVIKSQS